MTKRYRFIILFSILFPYLSADIEEMKKDPVGTKNKAILKTGL